VLVAEPSHIHAGQSSSGSPPPGTPPVRLICGPNPAVAAEPERGERRFFGARLITPSSRSPGVGLCRG
jgi:hypothetical protein